MSRRRKNYDTGIILKFLILVVLVAILIGAYLFVYKSITTGEQNNAANESKKEAKAPKQLINGLPPSIVDYNNIYGFYKDLSYKNLTDADFKTQMLTKMRTIFTGGALNRFEKFINEGSVNSGYYSMFFELERNPEVINFNVSNEGQTYSLTVKKQLVLPFDLAFSEGVIEMNTFIDDYKVSNMTQEEFDNMLNDENEEKKKTVIINLTDEVTFTLNNKEEMLIKEIDSKHLNSEVSFE